MSISTTTTGTGRRRATPWWVAALTVAVVAAGGSIAVAIWRSPVPFAGHTGFVLSVTTGELDGRPVVVSGGRDDTVRVWDLATGEPIGEPLAGHTGDVTSVAVADLEETPVVVSGSRDETVRVWDLATGEPIGEPFGEPIQRPFAGAFMSVAVTKLGGRPVVVSANDRVQVWDLTTGEPIGGPATDRTGPAAVAELDGAPVVVSGSRDDTLQVWNLATGEPIGEPFGDSDTGDVRSVAIGGHAGAPVVVSGGHRGLESTVQVWDLATGAPAGEPIVAPGTVQSVAIGALDGEPVIVSGSADDATYQQGLIRVWDLATGEPIGEPFGNTTWWPWRDDIGYGPVTVTSLDGEPVIVSGGFDHRVRVWELGTGKERTPSRLPWPL